jgi:hypothetical protein
MSAQAPRAGAAGRSGNPAGDHARSTTAAVPSRICSDAGREVAGDDACIDQSLHRAGDAAGGHPGNVSRERPGDVSPGDPGRRDISGRDISGNARPDAARHDASRDRARDIAGDAASQRAHDIATG